MDDQKLEIWGSGLLLVVTLMVAATVLFAQLSGEVATSGPWWLWWACYLGFVGAVTLTFWPTRATWITPLRAMVVAATLAAACVLLAPWGWTPILLVFSAAIAAHVVPRRVVLGLVVANCLVLLAFPLIGEAPWGEAVAFAAMYGVLQSLSVWAVWLQLSEADARKRLAVVNTELRATTALLAESSRSAERLRISRDLHDVIGHHLTALALELEVAAHRATPPASGHVERARGIAKDLLGEVRAAVGELRDRPADLADALGEVVVDLPRPRILLDVEEELSVDAERVGILVRCVQELVTNTIRHADAYRLWITVRDAGDGAVALTAEDDGEGSAVLTLGNGLTGMRERVEQFGGTATFFGRPGFRVEVVVPRPTWSHPDDPVRTGGVASPNRRVEPDATPAP